ncbi:hypothetical protein [Pseudomonas fluorescens]|uniref:hypothetical protein n=1 Tax=Pseudomonas TaxID=286 RepID=UPI003CFCCE81
MTDVLLEKIRSKLKHVFKSRGYGLDPDTTYYSGAVINDLGQEVVAYSESLTWVVMEKVQHDELPSFDETLGGIYSVRWSRDPKYQVNTAVLDVREFNRICHGIVIEFRKEALFAEPF